jgi:hypothetical protein
LCCLFRFADSDYPFGIFNLFFLSQSILMTRLQLTMISVHGQLLTTNNHL